MTGVIRTVLPDSSCLISLGNAGELSLLQKTFDELLTTQIIADEVGYELPSWIKIIQNSDPIPVFYFGVELDLGEASAIALAREMPDVVLILDDLKARRVAERLSMRFMGTLGVVVQAKQKGVIPSIRPTIQKLRDAGLYFSKSVERDALEEADE